MSSPTIHSVLGASSAYRWMSCPGSVDLSKNIPRKETEYSKEGTAAHALGEIAFAVDLHPSNWMGEKIEGITATEDMVQAVAVYVDFLQGLKRDGYDLRIESRFDLSKLNPPAPMFGTSDAVGYHRGERRLVVGDYKHGAGVPVEVTDNPQLKYYALGALLSFDSTHPVDEIEMVIIQPRAPHKDGPVRRWSCSLTELLDFSSELLEAAHKAVSPNADLNPGKHCRFCPAQPMCPALHSEAKAIAKTEFDAQPLLDPRLLSADELGYILERADLIEDWVRSIRQHVQSELETGKHVPGWKLVPKRATRVWTSEADVVKWAKSQKLESDEIYEHKLKSPAALEKVVGKKNLPKELFASVSSGYSLAPASDPRPAVTNVASDEFSAIPLSSNIDD